MAQRGSRLPKSGKDCGPFQGPQALGVARLGQCELFGAFSTAARRKVLGFARQCRFEPGQQLFEEGQPCLALYLLLDGAVKIHKVSLGGKEQVLRQLKPGQIFGAPPLFMPNGVYPATAVALELSQVLCVPRDALIRLLKEEPDLMLKALGQVSLQAQSMVRLAESISLSSVPERLAAHLLALAKAGGGPKAGQVLMLEQSQSELAAQLGTVREVLGRALHRLRKEGVLEVKGRRIVLLAPQALAEAT
jgi:CRP/FNR family transcriptional regulator